MEKILGTTILSVRRAGKVVIGGDGQVSMGNTVMKGNARKVRRLYKGRVLAGFAGATADAFTLFERFEGKLEKHSGHLTRAAVELAKDWRTDRMLRRLEALLLVADSEASLILTGTGDVVEPERQPDGDRLRRLLRPGRCARHAGHHRTAGARDRRARARDRGRHLRFTNHNLVIEELDCRCLNYPEEIVRELDKHIIGQQGAKRSVAIALRNRWRRTQVDEDLRNEITPKNILMIGPTGVGKTEIARRLAKLANAPFIKVEATKFTEVGYVGREVDSIIRDLADSAVKMVRVQEMEKVRTSPPMPPRNASWMSCCRRPAPTAGRRDGPVRTDGSSTRDKFRIKLRNGELDDKEIEIETSGASLGVEIMAPPGMEEMTSQLQGLFQNMGGQRTRKRKLRSRTPWSRSVTKRRPNGSTKRTSSCAPGDRRADTASCSWMSWTRSPAAVTPGADVSREGVQRDLLPLVEGCTVQPSTAW